MFRKVLVANHGAVAARVRRCLNSVNVASVAARSDADGGAPLIAALARTETTGVEINVPAILRLLRAPAFQDGPFFTGLVADTIR
jgi:acetyl/propionyl-CoA carboxylase alpha subunit